MAKIFYICQRNGQCPKPCGEDCRYTSNFFQSKLYHDSVKRIDTIPFLVDVNDNLWEVDMDWKYNLPVEFRKQPKQLVGYKYETLNKWEMEKKWITLANLSKMSKK